MRANQVPTGTWERGNPVTNKMSYINRTALANGRWLVIVSSILVSVPHSPQANLQSRRNSSILKVMLLSQAINPNNIIMSESLQRNKPCYDLAYLKYSKNVIFNLYCRSPYQNQIKIALLFILILFLLISFKVVFKHLHKITRQKGNK